MALRSAYETFKRFGGKAASFIQNNPTPAGYVSKFVAPTVNQLASSFQSSARQVQPMTDIGKRFVSSVQPAIRQLAVRATTTPVLPFAKPLTLTNLLTRPPGAFGALDTGSLYGAFSQAKAPQERMALNQELALDMTTPVIGITKSVKGAANPQALQRLRNLLTYQEDMKRIGYGIPGSRPIPDVLTSQKILAGALPQYYDKQAINRALLSEAGTEGTSWFTKTLQPIKGLTPDLQEAVRKHASSVNVAKINADEVAQTFKNALDPHLEWKLVQYSQEPTIQMAKKLSLSTQEIAQGTGLINTSRRFNDELFAKAKALGVDVGYLKNHIYQIFKESPDKVDDILQAKGLGGKPGFAHHRVIPNFTTAQELGLTPKFTTFAQLNAAANEALDKAIANQGLAKVLEKSGQLLPQMQAPANWEKITARWFPKATVKVGKFNTIEQDWYAPRQLATFLNDYFGGQQMQTGGKLLKIVADVSGKAQNIVLSGGLGPLNFFGVGQLVKEGTAGRIVTPLKAFFRTYIPGASAKYQANNTGLIREMAREGIPIRGLETYQRMYKNVVSNPKIGEVIDTTWHKLMDEPTFGKFMKELEIGFFADTKATLIKQGMSDQRAVTLAADAVRKFYGMADNLGRAQGVDDLLTTVFLAPRYREGMLNIFTNLAQAMKPGNWSNVAYSGLRKLAIGMGLTYGAYNVLNYRLNGHFMWDNPPGKEFELVIPVGDPKDRKYISVPWMPGFTAVPRRVISGALATLKGEPIEGLRQWGSLLSIPISRAFELIANKDYFGNEVYNPNNPAPGLVLYGAKSFLPSPGRAAVDYATGKSTLPFAIAQGLELPIRKGTFSTGYFEAIDEAKKMLTSEERKQFDFLMTADKKGGPGTDAEAEMMLRNANLLKAKQTVKLGTNQGDPLWSRPIQDIQGYLAYQLSQDTTQRAQIRIAFPWIPQVQYALSQDYYNSIQKQITPTAGYDPQSIQGRLGTLFAPAKSFAGTIPEQPTASPMQQLTPEQVKIVSAYTASPKGSVVRRQLLAQNPWLRAYWNANGQYYAQNPYEQTGPLADFLTSVGISSLETYSSGGYAGGGTKGKKITARKVKLVKIRNPKALKAPKLKLAKLLPLRSTKTRSLGNVKLPKAKRVVFRPNALRQARSSSFIPRFRVS